MSRVWQYYGPDGRPGGEVNMPASWIETVGPRELEIMLQARSGSGLMLALTHGRKDNAKRLAARRLVERELLAGPNAFGGQHAGWLYAYTLTPRGRTCWLRTRLKK